MPLRKILESEFVRSSRSVCFDGEQRHRYMESDLSFPSLLFYCIIPKYFLFYFEQIMSLVILKIVCFYLFVDFLFQSCDGRENACWTLTLRSRFGFQLATLPVDTFVIGHFFKVTSKAHKENQVSPLRYLSLIKLSIYSIRQFNFYVLFMSKSREPPEGILKGFFTTEFLCVCI